MDLQQLNKAYEERISAVCKLDEAYNEQVASLLQDNQTERIGGANQTIIARIYSQSCES